MQFYPTCSKSNFNSFYTRQAACAHRAGLHLFSCNCIYVSEYRFNKRAPWISLALLFIAGFISAQERCISKILYGLAVSLAYLSGGGGGSFPPPNDFYTCLPSRRGRGVGVGTLWSSGADPDPDPHVFGPPGFGSISLRYGSGSGSGSFFHQAKKVRKTLIPTALWLIFDFLSLKMMYTYLQKVISKKTCKKICFLLASWEVQ